MNIEEFKKLGIELDLFEGNESKTSPEVTEDTQKVSNSGDDKTYTKDTELFTDDYEGLEEQLEQGYLFSQTVEEEPPASEHYQTGIDPIAYGEVNLSTERMAGFYQMNVLKYVTRYQRKNGVEDLQKAKFYLDKLIELENQ